MNDTDDIRKSGITLYDGEEIHHADSLDEAKEIARSATKPTDVYLDREYLGTWFPFDPERN